jgi:hypothetical protein
MVSGYRMTGLEIGRSNLELDKSGEAEWKFMGFDESIARPDPPDRMLKQLSVSASLAFKIWQLSSVLRAIAISLAVILVGLLGWYCWMNWNNPIITIDLGKMDNDPWRLTWRDAALTLIAMVALNRLPAFARTVLRFVDYRKTAYEIAVGVGMGVLGWIAAGLHLLVFDRWYLRWGSNKRMLGSQEDRG